MQRLSPPLQPVLLSSHGDIRRATGRSSLQTEAVIQPSTTDADVSTEIAYASRVLQESNEPFTFKSVVYQTKLKALVPKPPSDRRKYISVLTKLPSIPVNASEAATVNILRRLPPYTQPSNFLCQTDRLTIKERLEDLLTSIGNKVLFLLMLELRTWYIRATARRQIAMYLLDFLWAHSPEVRLRFEPVVIDFMETRIRYFRDSVARYFRPRGSLTRAEDLSYQPVYLDRPQSHFIQHSHSSHHPPQPGHHPAQPSHHLPPQPSHHPAQPGRSPLSQSRPISTNSFASQHADHPQEHRDFRDIVQGSFQHTSPPHYYSEHRSSVDLQYPSSSQQLMQSDPQESLSVHLPHSSNAGSNAGLNAGPNAGFNAGLNAPAGHAELRGAVPSVVAVAMSATHPQEISAAPSAYYGTAKFPTAPSGSAECVLTPPSAQQPELPFQLSCAGARDGISSDFGQYTYPSLTTLRPPVDQHSAWQRTSAGPPENIYAFRHDTECPPEPFGSMTTF